MKKCSYCGKEYSDEASSCTVDGEALETVGAPTVAPTQHVTQKEIDGAREQFRQTFTIAILCAASFFVVLMIAAANGAAAFKIREAGGRYRGAGTVAPLFLVLLVSGLASFFTIPQSLSYWREYQRLRQAWKSQAQENNHKEKSGNGGEVRQP